MMSTQDSEFLTSQMRIQYGSTNIVHNSAQAFFHLFTKHLLCIEIVTFLNHF